jgi:hypothetical protein
MGSLTETEMEALSGGGFWGGLACGLALTAAFVAATSPEPFGKLGLISYGSTLIGCASAF